MFEEPPSSSQPAVAPAIWRKPPYQPLRLVKMSLAQLSWHRNGWRPTAPKSRSAKWLS